MWDRTSSHENVDDGWLDSEQDDKLIHGGSSVQQARTLSAGLNWAHSSTRPLAQKAKSFLLRLERGRRAGRDQGLHHDSQTAGFSRAISNVLHDKRCTSTDLQQGPLGMKANLLTEPLHLRAQGS